MNNCPLWLCFLLICFVVRNNGHPVHKAGVIMSSADIVAEYQEQNILGYVHLEAYRSSRNDEIMQEKRANEYGQLEWQSLGWPSLRRIEGSKSSLSYVNMFEMTRSGFSIYIDILTSEQKQAIVRNIWLKYNIQVDTSQIKKLKPSAFVCTTQISCENDETITIDGSTRSTSHYPLKVKFNIASSAKACFERYLLEHKRVDFECTASKERFAKSFKIIYKNG